MKDFFENAKAKNLCDRGARIWEHCGSKKALVDFALGSWGCDYLATAICQGWGIAPEVIAKDFAAFNNGKYTRNKDCYTSQMYCLPEGKHISINSTLTLVIGFDGTIDIEKHAVCEIYLVNSKAVIKGNGLVRAYLYDSQVGADSIGPIIEIVKDEKYGTV